MKRFLLVAILAAGCARGSVQVRALPADFELPPVSISYADFWAGLRSGAFRALAASGLSTEQDRLVQALIAVEEGRFDEATAKLRRLRGSADRRMSGAARDALAQILWHEGRWQELLRAHAGSDEIRSVEPLVRAFARAPPAGLLFERARSVLPTELSVSGSPVVEARLNGKPYRLWLDTGADLTVLSERVAEDAGLRLLRGEGRFDTATSRTLTVRGAVAERLEIGRAVFTHHPVVVAESGALEFRPLGLIRVVRIDGVLGWHTLRRLDLEIDYAEGRTIVRRPAPRAVERNLFWLGAPLVRCHLAMGLPILAGLDTGDDRTHLTDALFDKVPAPFLEKQLGVRVRKSSQKIWAPGGAERRPVRVVSDLTFVLSGHALRFRHIATGSQLGGGFLHEDAVLGSDLARKGRLRIDYFNRSLELATAPVSRVDPSD